ncbi:MAG: hypothetical protein ACTSQE_16420, partial [Candidatus Heimdallarchaeaceae archaeon]
KNKLKSIKVEIRNLEANKEQIGSEIQSLEKFQILYQQKLRLIEKNQVNIRKLREVSQDLMRLQNTIDELEEKEQQLSETLSQLNNQIEQIRRERNEISLFEKGERIPTNEIEIKANKMSLNEWREKHKHVKAIYITKQSQSKAHQELERLESEIKELEKNLSKYYNSYKIKAEDVYSYHHKHPELNNLETRLSVKQEVETQITEKEIKLRNLKSERELLLKNSTELEQKFINRKPELDSLFSKIIKNKDAIADQLPQLQKENEKINKEIDEIREKISVISKQQEDSNREYHELEDKLSIIIMNRKRLLLYNSNKIETVSLKEETLVHTAEIKLSQLKHLIDQCMKETDEYEEKKNIFDQQMETYIQDFRSLSINIDQKLESKKIKEFIENFGIQQIMEISTLIQSFTQRLNNLKEEIKAPKERLKNIVTIFVNHIKEIISKIRSLQSIKLEIPDLQYLNKKPIVKIKIQGADDTSIEGTVNSYFQRLFSQHEQFPEDLTTKKIIGDILKAYLEGRLRPIQYLFPDDKQKAVYKRIDEIKKSSGGERVTVAILLYCLIAYFRLKYTFGLKGKNEKLSFPLIMDNPFGKASRLDFIKLQVGLANKLDVQLIPFSGIGDIEAFHHYNNIIVLRKYLAEDGTHIVRREKDDIEFVLESSSVTVKPIVRDQRRITEFVGG